MIVHAEVRCADSRINFPQHTHKSDKLCSCIIQLCIFKRCVSYIGNTEVLCFLWLKYHVYMNVMWEVFPNPSSVIQGINPVTHPSVTWRRIRAFGMWCFVVGWVVPDILKDRSTFIFLGPAVKEELKVKHVLWKYFSENRKLWRAIILYSGKFGILISFWEELAILC